MIRSASRSLFRAALPKPIPVALRSRSLHVSSTCLANEVPVDPFADSDPKIQAFREKVGQSPAVMEAIANVGRVMESKGVDRSNPPGMLKMASLGLDPDVRQAVQKMMEECKKAGVEIDQELIQKLSSKLSDNE